MAGRFTVDAIFKATDKISGPISRIEKRVGKMTRRLNQGFKDLDKNVSAFGASARGVGMAAAAGLAVTAGAIGGVLSAGVEFQQTLVNAAAKYPGEIQKGSEAFKMLEDAARKTGATTEFTASQSAEALNFLAMVGFSAEASIAALPGVVDLATAAGMDLATATDIASDSLGAFGLATENAAQLGKNLARVNDVMARTATTTNTSIETMFEAIKDGAPVAKAAGASIETFAALTGTLANAGIKGGRAGTTLKNVFLSLSAPGAEAASVLKRLGVQTRDANGDMLDVVAILGGLGKQLDGLGTAEKSGVLKAIFGKIPIAGVNVLLEAGADKLSAYRTQLEGAEGAASKMAATMRDTVQGRLNSLNSAVEGVKISIFSMNEGPLADTIDRMTEWVRANEGVIASGIGEFITMVVTNLDSFIATARQIAGVITLFLGFAMAVKAAVLITTAFSLIMTLIGGAVTVVTTVLGALTAVVGAVQAAWFLLNLVFAASPIGLLVVAVGALIALGAAVMLAWEPVKSFFSSLGDKISGVIGSISGAASKFGSVFGFTSQDEATPEDGAKKDQAAQVRSANGALASEVRETRETNSSEVTIRDETGRATVTKGKLGPGLKLAQSGAM